jgi:hypothetical protein
VPHIFWTYQLASYYDFVLYFIHETCRRTQFSVGKKNVPCNHVTKQHLFIRSPDRQSVSWFNYGPEHNRHEMADFLWTRHDHDVTGEHLVFLIFDSVFKNTNSTAVKRENQCIVREFCAVVTCMKKIRLLLRQVRV